MARASRLTAWVPPFAIGLIVGVLIDFSLKIGGGLDWVAIAIPLGAAGVTVVGSLFAEVFRQGLEEDADRRRRMELHAESLSENALEWLQSLLFASDLWERTPRGVYGLCVAGSQGNVSVYSLKLWRYAEKHVQQDPVLGPKWTSLMDQIAERKKKRQTLERDHTEKVEAALLKEYGPGWVVGNGFGTPQPPRWYNADLVWNWTRSRRVLGPFSDQSTPISYGRADVPDEVRSFVTAGGFTVLSTNEPGSERSEKCGRIIANLQADASLRRLQDEIENADLKISVAAEELRVPAAEFYERTVESKKLVGNCPVCP